MESSELPPDFLQQDEDEYHLHEEEHDEATYHEWIEEAVEEGKFLIAEEQDKDFEQFEVTEEQVFIDEDDVQYFEQHYEGYEEDVHHEIVYEDEEQPEGYDFHDEAGASNTNFSIIECPKRKLTIVECEYCGQILKHPSKIQAHMRTHTGEKPFECTLCGASFSQKVPMLNHMRRHLGDLPYQCSFCPKKFVNNAQKRAHELRHQGLKRRGPPKPHLKPGNRKLSQQSSNAVKRQLTDDDKAAMMEWQPPFGQIQQPLSAAASKRLDEIIEAVATGTTVVPKKRIVSRSSLLAQCNICGLMLRYASKIQEHMRTHSGEKPFGCTVCGLRFARMYSLKMHMKRKHTEGRKISCTWDCGKKFVSVGARNEHERVVHSGIKRYLCNVTGCRRMFSRRTYLMNHRMKDHPSIHQPLFDPREVTAAEELDHQLDRAVQHNFQEEEEGEVLCEADMERLIHLPDGMILLPAGAQILEGTFVEEEDDEIPYEPSINYLEATSSSNQDDPSSEETKPPTITESTSETTVEKTINNEGNVLEEDYQDNKISETIKHVWMNFEGEQKKRMTVRILKRH